MSGFISEPERSHEHHVATVASQYGGSEQLHGQAHDRMARDPSNSQAVTAYEKDEAIPDPDISATQKMLSAVSGSLLTSILGVTLLQSKAFSS